MVSEKEGEREKKKGSQFLFNLDGLIRHSTSLNNNRGCGSMLGLEEGVHLSSNFGFRLFCVQLLPIYRLLFGPCSRITSILGVFLSFEMGCSVLHMAGNRSDVISRKKAEHRLDEIRWGKTRTNVKNQLAIKNNRNLRTNLRKIEKLSYQGFKGFVRSSTWTCRYLMRTQHCTL